MKINRILSDHKTFEPLLEEHLLTESTARVVWQLGKIDRAKYSIFKNDAEQEKFLNALAGKFRLYLKKERYLTDEQKKQAVDKYIELYRRVTDKFGSLPSVNTRSAFMTDAGDIMRDIFPTYSVSYKTMSQMEQVADTLAKKMGIIPNNSSWDYPKAFRELGEKIFKRHGVDITTPMNEKELYNFMSSLANLPYNMRALNDSNSCAIYVFAFTSGINSWNDDDYKDYFETAKKYYKIGRA